MNTHLSRIQQSLKVLWGINASLTPLDGEFDLNLAAVCDDGKRYLVKLMRAGCDAAFVDMQVRALAHVRAVGAPALVQTLIPTLSNESYQYVKDDTNTERLMWVLSFIEGTLYSQFSPHSSGLIQQLGEKLGHLHLSLAGFDHEQLYRPFTWNLMQSEWITDHIGRFAQTGRDQLLESILLHFQSLKNELDQLPCVAVHNDVNDNNIVVEHALGQTPTVAGLIDFGDMCAAPRICDLAIAGAYVVLDHPSPGRALAALVGGFHHVQALGEHELDLLLPLIRLRLAVSVVTSTLLSEERPNDPYLLVSQAAAWRFLEADHCAELLYERMRLACNFPILPGADRVQSYLTEQCGSFHPMIGESLRDAPVESLSIAAVTVPENPFSLRDQEAQSLVRKRVVVGGYGEPRLIYTDSAFQAGDYKCSDRRTVHLGVDVFAPAQTDVLAALPGTVVVAENRESHLDYGGFVVIKHTTDMGDHFYTMYGHLDPTSLRHLSVGQSVDIAQAIGKLGSSMCNGGWQPHLHLQLSLSIAAMDKQWPGVAYPDDKELWCALCPNPAALLNLPNERVAFQAIDEQGVRLERQKRFAPNLSLSYRAPLLLLRGYRHHLFDQWGRAYLDAYNNVPHVGHAHPDIQAVVARQLSRLNTNTRYLHPAQLEFAEAVLSTMPEPLSVCFCVNSGSEANELALRLARAHTGGRDMITPDHGYHGNTTGAIDISAYKFNAPGGVGKPDWVQLIDIPDDYRGRYRRGECDTASRYAAQVDDALEHILARNGELAGFIAETFPSVGGQIVPPDGYLKQVYQRIRAAGGVCIADEVQTGLGRLGAYYYGFEQQGVVPDIVVLGKPIGNGHPLGVVITTRAIAESFAQGPEFFSTFGGSTLSCLIGKTVLDLVRQEKLQQNAELIGQHLISGLQDLQKRHAVIGDVRGMGLFIGVELVEDRQARLPATRVAAHIVNRLCEKRVLTGLEGPHNNILKIRPPLTIEAEDSAYLLSTLDAVLEESVIADRYSTL